MARSQAPSDMDSLASEYSFWAFQPRVSSVCSDRLLQPVSSRTPINAKLRRVKCAIENSWEEDWGDYSPANPSPSPQCESIPADCAGLRADQALARLFPQHSRSRLQSWLKSGRI